MNLILGSNSPRRRELLAGLNFPYTAVSIDADESYPASLSGADIPIYISRAKARAYAENLSPNDVLLTADTIVWCNGEVLGKPKDENDARRMLRLLSGRTHQVFTGVTLLKPLSSRPPFPIEGQGGEDMISFADRTDVTFRELTDEEIDYYIDNYRPFDKAGAYGIQEWIGYVACTHLSGSYFNVMGFPTEKVYLALKKYGF